jgi:hypothetical protein
MGRRSAGGSPLTAWFYTHSMIIISSLPTKPSGPSSPDFALLKDFDSSWGVFSFFCFSFSFSSFLVPDLNWD